MRKATAIFWGVILVMVGALIVLAQLDLFGGVNIFKMRFIWPAILILSGLMFHVQFFASKTKSPGILVPGGIMLVYGCFFMYLTITGWGSVGYLWPVFLVGPGFGLLELKLFSRGKEGSWVPVIILLGISAYYFISGGQFSFNMTAAVILIIIGISIILGTVFKGSKKKEKIIDVHVDVD